LNQSREAHRWDQVADKPALLPMTVEETLRFNPSVPVWRRVTTRPVTLGGVASQRGRSCFCGWPPPAGTRGCSRSGSLRPGAAQRRPAPAIRQGLHYCLGASLGKLEARLALEELASRFPCLRLVEGQQLSFHPNISFRGPQSLRVRPG
jgi:cytochrome P450